MFWNFICTFRTGIKISWSRENKRCFHGSFQGSWVPELSSTAIYWLGILIFFPWWSLRRCLKGVECWKMTYTRKSNKRPRRRMWYFLWGNLLNHLLPRLKWPVLNRSVLLNVKACHKAWFLWEVMENGLEETEECVCCLRISYPWKGFMKATKDTLYKIWRQVK